MASKKGDTSESFTNKSPKALSESEARRPGPTQESDVHATPADAACRWGNVAEAKRILDTATLTAALRDVQADVALLVACRKGELAEVKRILDTGRTHVNCGDVSGRTPVMLAARRGDRDMVKCLVRHGADVSLGDDDGDNTLHWACIGGDRETVEFVLSLDGVDVNSRGMRSVTPVMWAAAFGHKDVVVLLVRHCADLSVVNDDGDNILHRACGGGDRETVEFVLSLDGVEVNTRNNSGETAADRARKYGRLQLLDLLESRGAVK